MQASSPSQDDPDAVCSYDVDDANHFLLIVCESPSSSVQLMLSILTTRIMGLFAPTRNKAQVAEALGPLTNLLGASNPSQFRIVQAFSIVPRPGHTIQQSYFYRPLRYTPSHQI